MKLIFKKMILASVLSLAGITYAQYYPNDNYGNNQYGNNSYEYYYDDYNYPDDYYYEYPDDYYTRDFYRGSYNDYRNAIISINWDRLFVEFRLSPRQVREIRILNDRFAGYNYWFNYYRYNPDRWYYDRFIALERILGPRVYVVFYQRYYNNYNPIVYFRNYRVNHYRPVVYVTPRYRNVDVRTYRNDDFRKGSFRGGFNGNDKVVKDNSGFRRDNQSQNNGGSFRNDTERPQNNGGFRRGEDQSSRDFGNNKAEQPKNNGFRNDAPKRNEEMNRVSNESRNNGGFRGGDNGRSFGKSNGSERSNGGERSNGRGFRQ